MKPLFLAASVFLITLPPALQSPQKNFDLPELHKIRTTTLSPSYSCRSKENSQKGYGTTALFLSKDSSGPELLFDGGCGSRDHLDVNMAGSDMSLIADLGRVKLEDLRADQAFNVRRNSMEPLLKFTSEAQVELGHTYAVLVNKADERGLFYVTITGYLQNERLDLRYSVKEFRLTTTTARSPGFDWEKKSTVE